MEVLRGWLRTPQLLCFLLMIISFGRSVAQDSHHAKNKLPADTWPEVTDDVETKDLLMTLEQFALIPEPTLDLTDADKQQILALWHQAHQALLEGLSAGSKMTLGDDGGLRSRQQCSDDLALIFSRAAIFDLWAVKMVDSWGKLGSGIFGYNAKFMGDYDTCMEIQTNRTFGPQYCTINLNLQRLGPIKIPVRLSVQLGICPPTSCTGKDIRTLFNLYLATLPNITVSVTAANCLANSIPLTDKALAVIVICSIFAALIFMGTIYDLMVVKGFWRKLVSEPVEYDTIEDSFQATGSLREAEKLPLLPRQSDQNKTDTYRPGLLGQFFLSFSVLTNGAKVMAVTSNPNTITCINGVRFFSMTWVILGHTFSMAMNTMKNVAEYNEYSSQRWTFMAVRNALVSVDSFFALSGLLMMYLVLKELKKHPPGLGFFGKFYFHRYWRLTPPYMLVLMVYVPLFKYFGDGPFWPQTGLQGKEECEDTWWTNLLYINNFVKDDKMCMGWSWYLANDMQFYIISPLIFIPMYLWGHKAVAVPLGMLVAHFITTGVISSHFDLTIDGGKNNWSEYYVKPYTRIGPYLVGMITGYLLYVTECKARLHKVVVLVGWMAAWAVALTCLYGVYGYYSGHTTMSNDVSALYNCLHRTGWAMALCWLIFACASGYGGIINSILSWPGLLPLSRLTYCAYLVHPLVIIYYFRSRRQTFYLDNNNMIFIFPGILCMSYFLAFVASMAFEAPFLGLEKIIMASGSRLVRMCKGRESDYGYDTFYQGQRKKQQNNDSKYSVRYSEVRKGSFVG